MPVTELMKDLSFLLEICYQYVKISFLHLLVYITLIVLIHRLDCFAYNKSIGK